MKGLNLGNKVYQARKRIKQKETINSLCANPNPNLPKFNLLFSGP